MVVLNDTQQCRGIHHLGDGSEDKPAISRKSGTWFFTWTEKGEKQRPAEELSATPEIEKQGLLVGVMRSESRNGTRFHKKAQDAPACGRGVSLLDFDQVEVAVPSEGSPAQRVVKARDRPGNLLGVWP